MGNHPPPLYIGSVPKRVRSERTGTVETEKTPQELGAELASTLDWDSRIIDAAIAALEDANFHAWAELLDKVKDFHPEGVRAILKLLPAE